jgi:hypothetical protein
MRADPGRDLQEAVIARMSLAERQAVRLRLAARGRDLAWRQADAAGPMTTLEEAEFLLRRLYPSMLDPALREILDQLAAAEGRGEWDGFRRPEDRSSKPADRR